MISWKNDCFNKINLSLDFNKYSLDSLKSDLHMTHSKWQKYGLSLKNKENFNPAIANTFEIPQKIKSKILSMIPNELLDLEIPEVWYLEVSGGNDSVTMVPPHVDKFRLCTINYYLQTNGETTHFYEYMSGEMEEIQFFCAKNNEYWILNTTIPHSVKLISNMTRSVIGVSFIKTPFTKVISYFS